MKEPGFQQQLLSPADDLGSRVCDSEQQQQELSQLDKDASSYVDNSRALVVATGRTLIISETILEEEASSPEYEDQCCPGPRTKSAIISQALLSSMRQRKLIPIQYYNYKQVYVASDQYSCYGKSLSLYCGRWY